MRLGPAGATSLLSETAESFRLTGAAADTQRAWRRGGDFILDGIQEQIGIGRHRACFRRPGAGAGTHRPTAPRRAFRDVGGGCVLSLVSAHLYSGSEFAQNLR